MLPERMPPKFKVLIYCPDRHIMYDDRTPEEVGVGGGITARIRMSRALARRGHKVVHVGNVSFEEASSNVKYVPLDRFSGGTFDIAVLTTSGDQLDLSPGLDLDLDTGLKIVWVHGWDKPGSFEACQPDYVYAVSKFIRRRVVEWGYPGERVLVQYNGYSPIAFSDHGDVERDLHRLVYVSHPSKGLDHALVVLHRLRQRDSHFHLDVYGGQQLWGGQEQPFTSVQGVAYHGLTGQWALAKAMLGSGFSLQMQTRQEPGALAIPEAQQAGCIIVASPVGVYQELVIDQETGVIISGDPFDPRTRISTANRVSKLVADPGAMKRIRLKAAEEARSSDEAALDWERHFHSVLSPAG